MHRAWLTSVISRSGDVRSCSSEEYVSMYALHNTGQWQASLPTGTDPDSVDKRQRMMMELEWLSWMEREQEIKQLEARRLQLFEQNVEEGRIAREVCFVLLSVNIECNG